MLGEKLRQRGGDVQKISPESWASEGRDAHVGNEELSFAAGASNDRERPATRAPRSP
jgi:hypothetical protein